MSWLLQKSLTRFPYLDPLEVRFVSKIMQLLCRLPQKHLAPQFIQSKSQSSITLSPPNLLSLPLHWALCYPCCSWNILCQGHSSFSLTGALFLQIKCTAAFFTSCSNTLTQFSQRHFMRSWPKISAMLSCLTILFLLNPYHCFVCAIFTYLFSLLSVCLYGIKIPSGMIFFFFVIRGTRQIFAIQKQIGMTNVHT